MIAANARCKQRLAQSTPVMLVVALALLSPSPRLLARADEVTAEEITVESEEAVLFYPTYGYRRDGTWVIPMRIWVHEKPGSIGHLVTQAAQGMIAKRAEINQLDATREQRFSDRTADFIADSESREKVIFLFDKDPHARQYQLTADGGSLKSDLNGLIQGELLLPEATARKLLEAQHADHGWLSFRAVSPDHSGVGRVRLIQPTGLSVVSDIDDTIKVTDIPAGEATVLRNTFFEPFVAAPCMAARYRGFGADTAFHYVSGGPWQLYRPLSQFLFSQAARFPPGSFHMKNVRSNPFESESYTDLWRLIASGSQEVTFAQKVDQISTLMQHFPERSFILIGDSGEKDPEIFQQLRDAHPMQVREIRIRDVVNDAVHTPGRLANMVIIAANETCTSEDSGAASDSIELQ